MKIAVDFDGTISSHTRAFYEFFWSLQNSGHIVGILTARVDTEKDDLEELASIGICPDFYIGKKEKERFEFIGEFKRRKLINNNINILIDDFGENNPDIENTFFEEDLPDNILILKVMKDRDRK